jgi:hypothetical protein
MYYSGQSPEEIIAGESHSNDRFVQNSTLPKDGNWDLLKQWGVVQGEESGELFFNCTLPQGWEKVPGSEHRESYLLDADGFTRASIFVKITSYDSCARITVYEQRYTIQEDFSFKEGKRFVVYDNGSNRIFPTGDFLPAYFATAEKGKKVGILFYDRYFSKTFFYYEKKRFFGLWVIGIVLRELPGNDAQAITKQEFYRNYHNSRVSNYEILDLLKELPVSKMAQEQADRLNEESGW